MVALGIENLADAVGDGLIGKWADALNFAVLRNAVGREKYQKSAEKSQAFMQVPPSGSNALFAV